MSFCAINDGSGYIKIVAETDCTEFVLMSQVDFDNLKSGSLQQMQETLNLLFAFDLEVFAIVELALILAFLTSHFTGRVVRWLGK
ncbi:hypothetical protein [Colwellia sp. 20A7]|uniref:hypothetical protein n=1 Tax=Colwellia sp. 20A7 TaxID=2689569 RepID=UPI001359AEFC|nr:hypothetical protein [Colwellia sp. 20A7]